MRKVWRMRARRRSECTTWVETVRYDDETFSIAAVFSRTSHALLTHFSRTSHALQLTYLRVLSSVLVCCARVLFVCGDGWVRQHYGPRNSSFALATFRPAGLAGVGLILDDTAQGATVVNQSRDGRKSVATGTFVTAPLIAGMPSVRPCYYIDM